MKKLGFSLAVFLFAVIVFASVANAAQSITESPDVKIVIDGEKGTYTDVTIIADGRTLLPLREVLTKLGVQNDDEHIIWDGVKRSVTVKKDDKVIYLEVGNNIGSVNGKEITIDVPPIIYPKNNRTYIPARFVAESLGMEVVWDPATRTVLIADKDNYEQAKTIITKSSLVMNDIKSHNFLLETYTKTTQNEFEMKYSFDLDAKLNYVDKAAHMVAATYVNGIKMENELYIKDGYSYDKNVEQGTWSKEPLAGSKYNEIFETGKELISWIEQDIVKMSSGMLIDKNENSEDYVLKGEVLASDYLNVFYKRLTGNENITDKVNMEDFYMKITVEKNTFYLKDVTLTCSGNIKEELGGGQFQFRIDFDNSDFNSNFVITLPKEVQ